jgi:hypothetical protein
VVTGSQTLWLSSADGVVHAYATEKLRPLLEEKKARHIFTALLSAERPPSAEATSEDDGSDTDADAEELVVQQLLAAKIGTVEEVETEDHASIQAHLDSLQFAREPADRFAQLKRILGDMLDSVGVRLCAMWVGLSDEDRIRESLREFERV